MFKNTVFYTKRFNIYHIFAVMLGLIFSYSILSTQKNLPSTMDMQINLVVAGLLAFASIGFLVRRQICYVSNTSLFLLMFMLVIAVQPLFNQITYLDGLIFPVSSLLLVALLSVIIANMTIEVKNTVLLPILLGFLLASSVLLVATQLIQLLKIEALLPFVLSSEDIIRPISNLGQPNQLTYVLAMGVVAMGYFYQTKTHKWFKIGLLVVLVWFGMGVGLSSSRGGLILCVVAILLNYLFLQWSVKKRLGYIGLFLLCFFVGYHIGSTLITYYSTYTHSAIARFSEGSFSLRLFLNQEAWLIFKNNWLVGAGWGNFAKAGLGYAEQLPWFTYGTHSHFFLSQIAAELGLLGLLPLLLLFYIIIKNIKFSLTKEKSAVLTIVGLGVLYSCSEFPMWYLRFLFLFFVFVAMLDTSQYKLSFNIKPLLILVLSLFCLGSGYYSFFYRFYAITAAIFQSDDFTVAKKNQVYAELPKIFGFSSYHEMMLFLRLPISTYQTTDKVALGHRVVSTYVTPVIMNKQAAFLAYDHQFKQSLTMYQSLCLHHFASQCYQVQNDLLLYNNENPQLFSHIYNDFTAWRQANPDKTGLTREREQAKQYQK